MELTVDDNRCVTYDFRYLFGVNAQFSQLISLIFHPALRHEPDHKPYEVHHLKQTFITGITLHFIFILGNGVKAVHQLQATCTFFPHQIRSNSQ